MEKNKHILITGGAGFVGSNLCAKLLREGHHVICLDNLYTGCISNIRDFLKLNNFEFLQLDVVEGDSLETLKSHHIDEIFHLACPASPVQYQKNPIYTLRTSFEGTLNMLELAKYQHCPILFTSTSEVYGNPLVHPQREDYLGNVNMIGIRSCYDEGKRCAESLCMDYRRQYGIDTKIVRIFNTYGPNMAVDDGRVISNFIVHTLRDESIPVYGNGNQTRSFMYVDDLIEGIQKIMESDYHLPVNIGNPTEITINNLAHKIIQLIGTTTKVVYHPLPIDDPIRRCPNISLMKNIEKSWTPKVSLEEGLKKTITYFRTQLKMVTHHETK